MPSRTEDLQARGRKVLLGNYRAPPLAMVRGAGLELWDAEGRRFLDFFGGIATCALGHCHPRAVAALQAQSERLWHVTNGYTIEPQVELAERLIRASGLDRAFFCNSGGEANEAALKLARRYFKEVAGQPERFELICFQGSFHGRTLATTAATGQAKYQQGYEPLPAGFVHVPYGDLDSVEAAIGPHTAGVWAEPIQGEGGVRVPPPGFLRALRALCDRHGLLLLLDEVQTGMGRTGKWFAFQHEGIRPDVISVAKAIGNGMPLAAMLCTEKAGQALGPGTHGSTFGGNPLATAVGVAVFDTLEQDDLISRCASMGDRLRRALVAELNPGGPEVVEVRGQGLLVGVELRRLDAPRVVSRAREAGVLFNACADRVVRLAPSFLVSEDQVAEGVAALAGSIAAAAKGP